MYIYIYTEREIFKFGADTRLLLAFLLTTSSHYLCHIYYLSPEIKIDLTVLFFKLSLIACVT